MEIHFCKNHPDRLAQYRCYYCKAPICADCRQTHDHHYFCSKRCYWKYKRDKWKKTLRDHKVGILAGGQVLLVLLLILQTIYFQNRLNHLPPASGVPAASDTVFLPALSAFLNHFDPEKQRFQVNATGNQHQNRYLLKLALQKNWVVNIWKNENPILSRFVESDTLTDLALPLTPGANDFRLMVLNSAQQPVYRDEIRLIFRRPLMNLMGRSVSRGNPAKKLLAFTFDGGSDDAHTREILQILRQEKLHCTLFLTGKFILRHPDLVKQMIADGHEIANHTYSHPHLTTFADNHRQDTRPGITRRFVQRQLLRTDSIFFRLTGRHLKPYWRAPYGEYNKAILRWAGEVGYVHIRWSNGFDTYDWVTDESSRLYRTPDAIFRQFQAADRRRSAGLNGVIVLMHLGSHRSRNHVFEVLPKLIEMLKKKGYQIGSISELLKAVAA